MCCVFFFSIKTGIILLYFFLVEGYFEAKNFRIKALAFLACMLKKFFALILFHSFKALNLVGKFRGEGSKLDTGGQEESWDFIFRIECCSVSFLL